MVFCIVKFSIKSFTGQVAHGAGIYCVRRQENTIIILRKKILILWLIQIDAILDFSERVWVRV